jgi:hypothetical protein
MGTQQKIVSWPLTIHPSWCTGRCCWFTLALQKAQQSCNTNEWTNFAQFLKMWRYELCKYTTNVCGLHSYIHYQRQSPFGGLLSICQFLLCSWLPSRKYEVGKGAGISWLVGGFALYDTWALLIQGKVGRLCVEPNSVLITLSLPKLKTSGHAWGPFDPECESQKNCVRKIRVHFHSGKMPPRMAIIRWQYYFQLKGSFSFWQLSQILIYTVNVDTTILLALPTKVRILLCLYSLKSIVA